MAVALLCGLASCGGGGPAGGATDDAATVAAGQRARALAAGEGGGGGGGGGGASTAGASIFTENSKLVRLNDTITGPGNDLMGDRVSLYNGSLEFQHTDISLPGNSSLPVGVSRRLTTGNAQPVVGMFGDWDIDIPHLHGIFSSPMGWMVGDGAPTASSARCSQFGPPPQVKGAYGDGTFNPIEYWHGSFLYVPGVGSQEILKPSASPQSVNPTGALAAGGPKLTTKDRWLLLCDVKLVGSSTSEGFTALSPDGTRYRFDRMSSRGYLAVTRPVGTFPPVGRGDGGSETDERGSKQAAIGSGNRGESYILKRSEIWILPSEVRDRHGNVVTYNYDPSIGRLASIVSQEASGSPRRIDFEYEAATGNLVRRVRVGDRVWSYDYNPGDYRYPFWTLSRVTLPDGSAWTMNLATLSGPGQMSQGGDGMCDSPPNHTLFPATGTITHPSGATGTFTLTPTVHGRSHVYRNCRGSDADQTAYSYYPLYFDAFALTRKRLDGSGLPSGGMTWTYDYGAPNASFAPCNGCAGTKTVTVTDPLNAVTRHTFGNRFQTNEGQLLRTDEAWDGQAALRTTTNTYAAPTEGPYPDPIGSSVQLRTAGDLSTRYAPQRSKTVRQQGVDFIWQANRFDRLARPLEVTRRSSLGDSRTELTTYADLADASDRRFTDQWVLGAVSAVTEASTGAVVEAHNFSAGQLQPESSWSFGRLLQTRRYANDGTLDSSTDAAGQITRFRDYKRGLARDVTYADGTTERAEVDDHGQIRSLRNAVWTTTFYDYDAMGRLSKVTPPNEPDLVYLPTLRSFARLSSPEAGLPAGHWRQTVQTGAAVTDRYFDGLWREVMQVTRDTNNENATRSVVAKRYDAIGRAQFESYPLRTAAEALSAVAPGSTRSYDNIGRLRFLQQTSELGTLSTETRYEDGFQRRVIDPKGQARVYSHAAWDSPSEDAIRRITAPEGQVTDIARDVFGKPTSITRSGGGKSLTRSYVYDPQQRLCKTLEPESDATVQDYDAVGNVAWRASGLKQWNGSCDRGAVPEQRKISFAYDARSRLRSTNYGDGSPGVTRSYTPDGLTDTVATPSATWTYRYNQRRLNTREEARITVLDISKAWDFTRAINNYGNVSALRYLDGGATVDYGPNALGQPTQVSGYASNVNYHPSGAVASYTLSNGISHTVTQNVRGLPTLWRDAGGPQGTVVQDRYAYDANGNVTAIADDLDASNSRSMPWYDGLDRLRQANGKWGVARYDYDALDNLVYSQVGARILNHNIDSASNRLASLTGSQPALAIAYDANGNVVQRGAQGFVFDIGNRMNAAPGKAGYAYDGHGRRVWAGNADGSTQFYAYGQGGQMLYTADSRVGETRFVYLGSKLIAETVTATGVTTYSHTDALGSPTVRTDGSGQVISRTRYEPYGATADGANPKVIGFTGHVNDGDTGLVYMQQRYYDAIAGRFLSVDPAVSNASAGTGFARYTYASHGPYGFIDPDGRQDVPFLEQCTGNCQVIVGSGSSGPSRSPQSMLSNGLKVVGGGFAVALGAKACMTGVGVPIGLPLAIIGASEMAEGLTFFRNAGVTEGFNPLRDSIFRPLAAGLSLPQSAADFLYSSAAFVATAASITMPVRSYFWASYGTASPMSRSAGFLQSTGTRWNDSFAGFGLLPLEASRLSMMGGIGGRGISFANSAFATFESLSCPTGDRGC